MIRTYLLVFLVILFWTSCANIVTPTGGEKDVIAPKIAKRSMKDSSLQFKGGRVQIEFDEFIQLKDIQNQLVVSPLMKNTPKVNVNKRTLTMDLPDSLLEVNTTYRLSLGNAVQDLHEGNALNNLTFTFSTGPYFDSLSMKGQVYDAQTGLPDTSVWIMLYPASFPDSTFEHQKPMYIQKPIQGAFEFANLPSRPFRVYALQDLNGNRYYDLPYERVAFLNKIVHPMDSSIALTLYSFQEKPLADTSSKLFNRMNSIPIDKQSKLTYKTNLDTNKKTVRTFDINDSIVIAFSKQIKLIDETKIRLYQNEILDAAAEIKLDSSKQKLIISTDWGMEVNYTLSLLKGFAIDSASSKADSAIFNFKTKRFSDYGFASLIVEKNPANWLELMQGSQLVARKNAIDTIVIFELLNPGSYQVRILHDENNNAKWDTGNLKTKKMPELVERIEQEILIKANWENKIKLNKASQKK